MTDPTPLPWEVDPESSYRIIRNGKVVCHLVDDTDTRNCLMNKSDLTFIVEAVNTYAQHKEVIKDLLEALREARFKLDGYSSVDFIDKAIQKAQELSK